MLTPIQLDQMRYFRYGMKALSLMEKTLGCRIAELDFERLNLEELAKVWWAGLVHEDPKLTPDRVMELVDDHASIELMMQAMAAAMTEAFGKGKADGADDAKKPS